MFAPFPALALQVIPNDPHFDTQYYIKQTQVDQAWEYSIGSPNIIIAVIDSGVDLDHPDLKDNIWINKGEIPNNNKDDDKNGYVDDVHGWNFVENNNDPNPQFADYSTEGASHGTLVAGIIAASGHNGKGIAGISWNSKIMPLRALNSLGEGNIEEAAKAIKYAANNGADIINLSFVGSNYSIELIDAVKYAYKAGAVLIAAVGNDAIGNSSLSGGNLDVQPIYPACFKTSFDDLVIGVGSVDQNNQKAVFSNFGQTCLEINAPSVDIVSTQVIEPELGTPFNAEYSGFWNGTSFAAPQISGLAALIKSVNKNYNNKQISSLILDTADKIESYNPELKGMMGRGLVNARRALRAAAPVDFIPQDPLEIINLQTNNFSLWINDQIAATVPASNFMPISISFKNKGTITWQPHLLKLKITDKLGQPLDFSPSEFTYQNSQNVLPSQIAAFYKSIKTPSKAGLYEIKFQLTYKNQDIKGGALYKKIQVTSTKPAVLTDLAIPLTVLKKWGSMPVTAKIKNNSGTSWLADSISLKIETNDKNIYMSHLSKPQTVEIAPGTAANFSFIVHFKDSALGIKYYTLKLQIDGKDTALEGAEKIMRID